MPGQQTQQKFEANNKKQMLVLVRYKPAGMATADALVGGAVGAVQGVVDKVEDAAASIPGLSLFFKEEKEPEKKCDKEYNYFKEYKDWDKYIDKMKDDFPEKLNPENLVISHEFDTNDTKGREQEGKKLANQIKSKISGWKESTAAFHFVGLGQGGNVANECIKELSKEEDFKKKWKVDSVVYVGTPLYAHLHNLESKVVGNPRIISFGNDYDLTQNAIQYFEPNDQLLKLIAESNTNTLSVFTGKIKTQLMATLSRLLSIEGFGTSYDNKGNLDKITQTKDDVSGLVDSLVGAVKTLIEAVPDLWKLPDLPEFDKMANGMGDIPKKSIARLDEFVSELSNIAEGTSLDTSRVNIAKIFNFLCPLVDHITGMLKVLSPGGEAADQMFDQLIQKAGVKKILAPAKTSTTSLPIDPYIEKAIEMAKKAEEAKEKESNPEEATREISKDEIYGDQANIMIAKCKGTIADVTKKGDLDLSNKSLTKEAKAKIGEAFAAMLLPMMPSKKKFYGQILDWIPLGGINGFLSKLTSDAAFGPLKSVISHIKSDFDFDAGTPEKPGLKTSLANFDKELKRITGYLNKNNFPIHKDANSLYFIYNSHNVLLKKPWGNILHTIDEQTGYLDVMKSQGFENFYNLEKNEYQGGAQKDNVQPAKAVKEEETV